MAGRKMDASELAAAEIVAAYLEGREEPRDVVTARDGTHDFDVLLKDGRRVALEVTAAADHKRIAFDDRAFRTEWMAPELEHDWWLVLSRKVVGPPARVDRLVRQVLPLLRILEQHGITEVGRTWFRPAETALSSEPIEAQAALLVLGTNVAHLLGPRRSPEAGQVFLSFSDGFGSDAGQLNSLVVAAAESNRSKLVEADADERHLFVWMNPSYSRAEAAASLGHLGDGPLGLPPEIDRVWLSTQGVPNFGAVDVAGIGVLRLWTVRPPGAWQSISLRPLMRR
jgi:hypothetical protein